MTSSHGLSLACFFAVIVALFAAATSFGPFSPVGQAEASGVIVFPKQDALVQPSGIGSYVTVERTDLETRSSTLVRIPTDAVAL